VYINIANIKTTLNLIIKSENGIGSNNKKP
jgi:hypothetical protein